MTIDMTELRAMQWKFEHYMDDGKWDALGTEGIYRDDGEEAVAAFLEFVENGYVTDHEGGTL